MPSEHLKAIEAEHSLDFEGDCPRCGTLGGAATRDFVLLARALDEIESLGHNGAASAYCSACVANSTLAQVAGESDEHPTGEPVR